MIYTCKPKKISIYINTGRKTIAQVKAETGCDAVINGGFYNMSTFKPCCVLIADGNILAYEWNGEGYCFDTIPPVFRWSSRSDKNFVYGVPLVVDGKARKPLDYAAAWGGARQRTAMGRYPDGRLWLYCDKVAITPEQLQQIALDAGLESAIMLDGGGSSQCIFPAGSVTSSRIVHNLICVWADDEQKKGGEKMLIALDAGHGMNTAGKRCMKSIDPNETREWFLNDRISRYVESMLAAYNCEVMRLDDRTGKTDVPLSTRIQKANDANANVLVSIHANAGINGGSGGGICVFAAVNGSATSDKLQKAVYKYTVEKTGLRGNRYDGVPDKNFDMIYFSKMPAILGEFGFMDSTVDTPIILTDDFAKKCADGIVLGLVEVMGLIKKQKPTKPVDGTIYRVQVGAFSVEENALNLKAELEGKGYKPYIVKEVKA